MLFECNTVSGCASASIADKADAGKANNGPN
jgi:hypothetical protein